MWKIIVIIDCARNNLFSKLQELEDKGYPVHLPSNIEQMSAENRFKVTFIVTDHQYSEFLKHTVNWISKELILPNNQNKELVSPLK